MSYPLIRRYVDMPGQKVTPQIIQTNGNDKDPFGTGGTCFGDSGGPLFLNQFVGVTSYTYTQLPLPRRLPAGRHHRRPPVAGHVRRRLSRAHGGRTDPDRGI